MSMATLTPDTQSMKRLFDRRSSFSNPDRLIVADAHPEIEFQIANLNGDSDSVIFRRSFEPLSDHTVFPTALNYACADLNVATVILVGHSRAYTYLKSEDQNHQGRSILARANAAQRQLAQCKQQFADEVQYLLDLQAESLPNNVQANVYGVFYLHESGVFLLYQPETDLFVPFRDCIACS